MSKRKRRICAICGEESKSLTRDHIPPSSVYPEGIVWKGHPIIVRTCPACNNGSSHLDTEFGVMMNWMDQHPLDGLDNPNWRKLKSMLDGQRKLKKSLLESAEPVELVSEGGISLGPGAVIRKDMDRMFPLIQKIVRGLHYRHTGKIIPSGHDILIKPLDFGGMGKAPSAEQVLSLNEFAGYCAPLNIEHPEIFDYRFAIAEDRPDASAWILIFRGKLVLMCFVGDGLFDAIDAGPGLSVA